MTDKHTPKEEAKEVVDSLQKVVDGKETLAHVFAEIDKDRQTFKVGSKEEKQYTELIHREMQERKLIPELSIHYAKENFKAMSTQEGEITKDSFYRFRYAEYPGMTKVEKSFNNFLTANYDKLKNADFGNSVTVDKGDLDAANKEAIRDRRSAAGVAAEAPLHKNEAGEVVSTLTANGGKIFRNVTDSEKGGITIETIDAITEHDNYAPKTLDAKGRRAMYTLSSNFKEISQGDDVISNVDLKYWARKNGANVSDFKR